MELSEWVLAARNKLNMTQEQFAAELHCSKGNVSAWERGRHEPSFNQIRAIAALAAQPLHLLEALEGDARPTVHVARENSPPYISPTPPKAPTQAGADELGLLEVWWQLSHDAKDEVIQLMRQRLEDSHRRAAEALNRLERPPT